MANSYCLVMFEVNALQLDGWIIYSSQSAFQQVIRRSWDEGEPALHVFALTVGFHSSRNQVLCLTVHVPNVA